MKKVFKKSVSVLLAVLLMAGIFPAAAGVLAADAEAIPGSLVAAVASEANGSAGSSDASVAAQASGTFMVTPLSVRFEAGGSAVFTCSYTGYEGMKVTLHIQGDNPQTTLYGSFGEWEGDTCKFTVHGNNACRETARFWLTPHDSDQVLAQQTVFIEVTQASTFTVTPDNLEFTVGSTAKLTCTFSGFTDHELVNVYAYSDDDGDFLIGTWSDWDGNTIELTLSASAPGTTNVYVQLLDDTTKEVLAERAVAVKVTQPKKTFFEALWDIISFPFKIILYPFIFLWTIIFG